MRGKITHPPSSTPHQVRRTTLHRTNSPVPHSPNNIHPSHVVVSLYTIRYKSGLIRTMMGHTLPRLDATPSATCSTPTLLRPHAVRRTHHISSYIKIIHNEYLVHAMIWCKSPRNPYLGHILTIPRRPAYTLPCSPILTSHVPLSTQVTTPLIQ